MLTSLYLDRGTFIHRLHPAVKLFALFIMFWSVFWVDHPLALLPVAIVMVLMAQASRSWSNFYAFRWFLILMIPPTMIELGVSARPKSGPLAAVTGEAKLRMIAPVVGLISRICSAVLSSV